MTSDGEEPYSPEPVTHRLEDIDRHFTEMERAPMRAFGDLASLALSQSPSVKAARVSKNIG